MFELKDEHLETYDPFYYHYSKVEQSKVHARTHTHTHTHTQNANAKKNANSLAADNSVMRTWRSQDACALSRHYEPVLASSWSRARYSQESDHASQLLGVGT